MEDAAKNVAASALQNRLNFIVADAHCDCIHEFSSSNQSQPASNLIEMPDGGFLGMTGAPINGTANAASIYQLKSNGEFTTLFQFSPGGSQCASGAPNLNSTPGALTHASDGNLCGVCYAAGSTARDRCSD